MSRRSVRVGIVGVGNCASSFVQGLSYYRDANATEPVPGLMNIELGGYHVGDIEVASAFDIVIDAVRCAKLARDRGIGGALIGPSRYFMKSPPEPFTDSEARERTIRFIRGETEPTH